jgi:ribosomal protein L33
MIEIYNLPKKAVVKFFEENGELVNRYIVTKIKKNYKTDQEKIELYRVKLYDGSSYVALIDNKDILSVLNDIITMSIKEEKYELAKYATHVNEKVTDYFITKYLKDNKLGE